jgi:hypothetical protein
MKNILKLQKDIQEQAKHEKGYNTGLVGEIIIISAYKQMTIDNLEKLRVILNNIIREKKEYKRIQELKNDNLHNNNNNAIDNKDNISK